MAGRSPLGSANFLRNLALRLGRLRGAPLQAAPTLLRLDDPPQTFRLEGSGPWWVGRGRRAQVRLLDDPFVSRRHLRIRRHGASFTVEAALRAVNAATLDHAALPPGVPVLLAPGAVLVAGKSRLVFQPDEPLPSARKLGRLP